MGLFGDHDSGLVPGFANVPEERRVHAVTDTDDLEVGFGGAPTEKQHRRVRVTPSRCPDQALHILELIVDCLGPKRCRDVLFGRAPDEGGGDLPLEKCRGAQAHEPKVPAKLQRGVPAGLDVGSRYGFPPCAQWNVVEQRFMDRRFHRRGGIERRNTLATLVLNRRETRLAALAGVEGVPGKSRRVHAVDDCATSEHAYVWFLQARRWTWDGGIRAFIIHGTARRAGGLR